MQNYITYLLTDQSKFSTSQHFPTLGSRSLCSTGTLNQSKPLAQWCILTSLPSPQRPEIWFHLTLFSTTLQTRTIQRHRPWMASHYPDIKYNTSWLVVACCTLAHRLWTESYHPDIHNSRGLVTACYNSNTDYGRKLPSWDTKQYKLPGFAWNYPTQIGATTWTLNTEG